jgi:predicted CopG family antitoxin
VLDNLGGIIMSTDKSIQITENLYKRLENHAKGFDTPCSVIERLLSFYEDNIEKQIFQNSIRSVESNNSLNIYQAIYDVDECGIKIGRLAKESFRFLFQNNLLDEEIIKKFHEKQYSKNVFKINFPLFVSKEGDTIDEHGHRRYYKEKFGEYYLCSQWLELSREKLIVWLRNNNWLDDVLKDMGLLR